MIRRPPRSTPLYSSAASDVYKRQVYRYMGIPKELYTPLFAIARAAGWGAHVMRNVLGKPTAGPRYTGHWRSTLVIIAALVIAPLFRWIGVDLDHLPWPGSAPPPSGGEFTRIRRNPARQSAGSYPAGRSEPIGGDLCPREETVSLEGPESVATWTVLWSCLTPRFVTGSNLRE